MSVIRQSDDECNVNDDIVTNIVVTLSICAPEYWLLVILAAVNMCPLRSLTEFFLLTVTLGASVVDQQFVFRPGSV